TRSRRGEARRAFSCVNVSIRSLQELPTPREEFLEGTREIAPVLVGTIPFGFVVGVAAVAAGMTPFEGIALSVLSFSGIAHLIAAQLIAVDSPVLVTIA